MRSAVDLRADRPRRAANNDTQTLPCGALENMPTWLICIPLVIQWCWLALRYRSLTLPSVANPAITSGGLVGEGKLEYFQGMGQLARSYTARHCAISTQRVKSPRELRRLMERAELSFPIVVKPDLGLCGHGVQRVDGLAGLQHYLATFPANEIVVAQEYLPQEDEAGIFYMRDPLTGRGRLTGLALRDFPRVIGDGRKTITDLIKADRRASRLMRAAQHDCRFTGSDVPAAGQVVRLATIGSTRVGGLYRDGGACITPQLTSAIDAIARDMPSFHFGRFDVRFTTVQELSAGVGFRIMEINGAGSEAIEAWDPNTGMVDGFGIIFAKQRMLFAIGARQRDAGVQPMGLLALARLHRRQRRLIARYPPSN